MPLVRKLIEGRSLSPENPNTSWDVLLDALSAWGGGPTAAGVQIGETRAMNLSAVYRASSVISNAIAKVPLKVMERVDGAKREAPGHPLWSVVHDQPNPEMVSFTWRQVSMFHALMYGNAYSEIETNGRGEVVGLWPLLPDRTRVERRDGRKVYVTRLADGTEVGLPDARVLHIPALGFDGRSGVGILQRARESLGLSAASEEYGARFFGNGSRASGVLEHPGKLGEQAHSRLRSSWEMMHQGLSNQHRVAILEEGMKFHQTSVPPEEAQFLETRKFQVIEVARWFGVPPHKLYDLERATFSNIEHQAIEYVDDSIMPWVVLWQQSMDAKLVSKTQAGRFCIRFVVDGLVRGDMKSRADALAVMRQNGALNADEWREVENMGPLGDEQGKLYIVQSNMVPVGKLEALADAQAKAKEAPAAPPPADPAQARMIRAGFERVIRATAEQMVGREVKAVRNALERAEKRGMQDFHAWLLEFYAEQPAVLERAYLPALLGFAEATEGAEELSVRARVRDVAEMEARESERAIRHALQDGAADDQIAAVRALLATWEQGRPADIARREAAWRPETTPLARAA